MKTKAYLSSSCVSDPRLQCKGFCYSSAVRCSLQLRSPWIRAVAPSPPAGASELTLSPGLQMVSALLGLPPMQSYFMCLTETWIHAGESIAFSEILPPGCTFLSSPQTTGKGGGVACGYKSSFHCWQTPSVTFFSFELQLFELNCSPSMLLAVVYRPP